MLGAALAVLMRVSEERRAELAAQVLQRLAQSGENDYRRHLLAECAQAYSGLSEDQGRELDRILLKEPFREARAMTETYFEKGLKQGMQQGVQQGQRQTLLMLLENRFGSVSPNMRQRLEALEPERVRELLLALMTAGTLEELGLED